MPLLSSIMPMLDQIEQAAERFGVNYPNLAKLTILGQVQ
jgi:hypothetical protein